MKKLLFFLAIIFIGVGSIKAQHEVKVNALGLGYSNYAISYEYGINQDMGATLTAGFFRLPKFIRGAGVNYNATGITAEFRYYLGDKITSGFWIGPYLKYGHRKGESDWNLGSLDIDTFGIVDFVNVKTINNKLSLGIASGYKYVSKGGFIFGIYGGLGRSMFSKSNYSFPALTEHQEEIFNTRKQTFDTGLFKYQLRLGINIGYRFGGGSNMDRGSDTPDVEEDDAPVIDKRRKRRKKKSRRKKRRKRR